MIPLVLLLLFLNDACLHTYATPDDQPAVDMGQLATPVVAPVPWRD